MLPWPHLLHKWHLGAFLVWHCFTSVILLTNLTKGILSTSHKLYPSQITCPKKWGMHPLSPFHQTLTHPSNPALKSASKSSADYLDPIRPIPPLKEPFVNCVPRDFPPFIHSWCVILGICSFLSCAFSQDKGLFLQFLWIPSMMAVPFSAQTDPINVTGW